ncbi:MAG: DnaA regulatory inactivator Hda [Azoarcus sp.]|jgi:DnaA family protein|nr:DnaA regulatory inactivator Hda [Azoarcus sp.]
MKQLVLDLHPDRPPTLDNFVPGGNAELLASLALLADAPAQLPCAHLYLWGAHGSGRSHLLQAVVARARALGRPAFYFAAAIERLPEDGHALLAVDDVEALAPAAQIALFNAFNRARGNGQSLLLAGGTAPQELALREDLRTRIGQSLIFEARPLDDVSRAAILYTFAARRGLRLGDEVVGFLLAHGRRDLPGLLASFEALDAASLEHKRPITLPLLRQLVREGLPI